MYLFLVKLLSSNIQVKEDIESSSKLPVYRKDTVLTRVAVSVSSSKDPWKVDVSIFISVPTTT